MRSQRSGRKPSTNDAPGEGACDDDPAICSQDAPEIGVGLEGGDEPIRGEAHDPESDEDDAALLADALPHEPGAADLGERRRDEENQRLEDRHQRIVPRSASGRDLDPKFKAY